MTVINQTVLQYRYGGHYVARRHKGCNGLHFGGFPAVKGLRYWARFYALIDWE
jgi:hypothetical protein